MGSELRDAWGEWISDQGPWHVFGALTYDQSRRGRDQDGYPLSPPDDIARAHARRWLLESTKLLHGRLEAGVVALEYQKSGWPHFHPLLRLAGGLQGHEFAQLGGAWFDRHGYARLEEPRDQVDVAAYASKYLVKELARGDILFWPPRGPWPAHQDAILNTVGSRSR